MHFIKCILCLNLRCGSAGKESACNVGDLVQSLGWEDPLEKGKATHSSILAWRIHRLSSPWGRKESDTTEQISTSLIFPQICYKET